MVQGQGRRCYDRPSLDLHQPMYLQILLLSVFVAGIGVSAAWRKLALRRAWFDVPNERSSHSRPTPKGGGSAFALLYSAVMLVLQVEQLVAPWSLLLCVPALALAAAGLLDDLQDLGIPVRLVTQALAVILALFLLPGQPVIELPAGVVDTPLVVLPLLILAWLWLINLYNFMDGIDGLAAGEGIFVALALGWFALAAGADMSALPPLVLAAVLAGFLWFNWMPARLFMGDAGSNFLGFMLAAIGLGMVTQGVVSVWTLVILFAAFIADSTLTLLKRMRAGLVWYHGHRSHAYQLLARERGSHAHSVLAVMTVNVVWLLPLAWTSVQLREWGLPLAALALAPLLLLVDRCHRTFLAGGMK